MRLRTLLRYLIGDRQAILELAASRWALPVGALFVLSAGLAREYDGEDLLHEPWHLLIPFGASLLSSLILFGFACVRGAWRSEKWPGFFRAYQSFLGLFWLTAPLAWLYAIPYERFLDPRGAAQANLATLGLVAAWRVALMTRVLVVVLNYTFLEASTLVMTFAQVVVLLALYFLPFPLLQFMGGVRLSDADSVVRDAALVVLTVSLFALPVLLVCLLVAVVCGRPNWQVSAPAPARPNRPLWLVAFASVAVWVLVLPFTQPEQQLRWRVEQDFRAGRFGPMLAEMSAHAPEDFPPHWQPLPRYWKDGYEKILDVCEEMVQRPPAPWVRQVYLNKLRELMRLWGVWHAVDVGRVGALLTTLPEGPTLLRELDGDSPSNAYQIREQLKTRRSGEEGVNGQESM
jgi:hypothetical protein